MDVNLFKKVIPGFLVLTLAAGFVLTAGCTGSSETAPADAGAGLETLAESTFSSSAPVSSATLYNTHRVLPTAPSTGWINGDAVLDIITHDTNEAMVFRAKSRVRSPGSYTSFFEQDRGLKTDNPGLFRPFTQGFEYRFSITAIRGFYSD